MAHAFSLKEIALQAGVSLATVDRVLHQREHVRAATRVRVEQALVELERQRLQVGRQGRRLSIDVVMETPERFSRLTLSALARVFERIQPVALRARDHVAETWPLAALLERLDAIARRGSHGVLLKAPHVPETVASVERLHARGIPVVTLATDLETAPRLAYVGMDNTCAGQTAAYLMAQWLGPEAAEVLVSSSGSHFLGEGQRVRAFSETLGRLRPDCAVHVQHDGKGLFDSTLASATRVLHQRPHLAAVYSVGGANAAVVRAFAQSGRACRVFIGHDLDDDNRHLLHEGHLQAVLHHDLEHDLHQACLWFMHAQGIPTPVLTPALSRPEVITPYNVPAWRR
jgi:LacI family transcriptional regulator